MLVKIAWFTSFLPVTRLSNHDLAMTLHHAMFVPAIERLASNEQKAKWLPRALRYEWIGTYAQTELGHGRHYLFCLCHVAVV